MTGSGKKKTKTKDQDATSPAVRRPRTEKEPAKGGAENPPEKGSKGSAKAEHGNPAGQGQKARGKDSEKTPQGMMEINYQITMTVQARYAERLVDRVAEVLAPLEREVAGTTIEVKQRKS